MTKPSDKFEIEMSHFIRDLSASFKSNKKQKCWICQRSVEMSTFQVDPRPQLSYRSGPAGAWDDFADWVDFDYVGSRENVRCMMGYIVDL